MAAVQNLYRPYNTASKVTQFQLSNLLPSLVCSIILWTQAYDAMKLHVEMQVRDLSIGLEKQKFVNTMSALRWISTVA